MFTPATLLAISLRTSSRLLAIVAGGTTLRSVSS
ncbi:Uncharacterised protein [Mycobacterium tuberculosis]|nr:Uncharacterised protein [Mycobacterium tuberculosis]COY48718.1 Uncharacterised protein [Mycobacterium tuberculosis]COZ18812.1 Uncharacterised protein [Mycobacterium tuberculosis]